MSGDQFFRRLSLLHPIFERGHGVKLGESRTSAAVMNPWDKKQPKEVFRLFASAYHLDHTLVVANRRRRHDGAIGPTMPHENLTAPRLAGTQIDRGRVVDSPRPGERAWNCSRNRTASNNSFAYP